ncbi:11693_t:CDS:2, partial [Racocetra fulgida]
SDASQDNTNSSMIYLKEDDKNNINEAYRKKKKINDSQAESSKTSKAKKKRNPLQGSRFHKLMISKDVSKYSIVEDLQQIKANISIAQLAAENPKYLRELIFIEFRHITRIPKVEAISKEKTKEESFDKSESEYEFLSESDESTKYEDKQLEERIYTLNLWQEIEKENLKQMCLYYSFNLSPKLNVRELDEKQQKEFYNLVNEYIDIFAQNDSDLGRNNKIQYEIK